jgi:hypothetical protein
MATYTFCSKFGEQYGYQGLHDVRRRKAAIPQSRLEHVSGSISLTQIIVTA